MKVALYSVLTWYLICVALCTDESLSHDTSEPVNVYDVTTNKRVPKRETESDFTSTTLSVGNRGIDDVRVDTPISKEWNEIKKEGKLRPMEVRRRRREMNAADDPKAPRETLCKAGCMCV